MTETNAFSVLGVWQRLRLIGFLVLALVLLTAGAYAIGNNARGRADALALARHARQDSIDNAAQQLRVTTALARAEQREARAAVEHDSLVRAVNARARERVRVASDTQLVVIAQRDSAGVAVDSVLAHTSVPREVVSLIRSSDSVIVQDSLVMRAQAAELQTLWRSDSLHVQRERLLEEQLAATKPQRCGRRCGFVAGAVITAGAVFAGAHPDLVTKAASWMLHHVL